MSDFIRRSDAVKAIASQLAFTFKTAEGFSWGDFEGAAEWMLAKCETVDAEQVIHCRDCTEYEPDEDGDPGGCCTNTAFWMPEDGYCSDGQRKAEP